MYLSLYCKGSKRVTQGLRVRGSWRPNITAIFWPPLLWPSALCLSRSPGLLNQRPRGPLCWVMAFFTASYQHLLWTPIHQGPKAPSAWCGFSYHISSITRLISNCNSSGAPRPLRPDVALPTTFRLSPSPTLTGTVLTSVLTELYNSSTPTQSPTRSLKSHVWSSSSGNNCHAVHRSLSSGASVYECTMRIFYLIPFRQPISAQAISSHNCH